MALAGRSHRSLTFHDALHFAKTAAPIAAIFTLIPTLQDAQSPQFPQLPIPPHLLLKHFTHSNQTNKPFYTIITYALCHADKLHLGNNLKALLFIGPYPHKALGRYGFLATFLAGVILAALDPFRWREAQRRAWLDSKSAQLVPWLTPSVARAWDQHGGWVLCGASAGISAIIGADVCILAENCYQIVSDWGRNVEANMFPSLAMHVCGLIQSLNFLAEEHRGLVSGGTTVTAAHAGHLMGFWCGVLGYAILKFREHVGTSNLGAGFRGGGSRRFVGGFRNGGGGRRLGSR